MTPKAQSSRFHPPHGHQRLSNISKGQSREDRIETSLEFNLDEVELVEVNLIEVNHKEVNN